GRIPPDLPPYNIGGWLVAVSPADRRSVWENGLRALARIHAVEWQRLCFLDDPAVGAVGLDQYLHWVDDWYRWAATGRDLPLLDAAMSTLHERRPLDAAVGVAWGDA